MAGLYITGIVIGILVALLFKGTLFKGEAVPFVMELPNYRLPGAKNVRTASLGESKRFSAKSLFGDLDRYGSDLVPAKL